MREVGTGRLGNRVKVVRTGTLEPAHADGPKLDDPCKRRDGVWRDERARQEDEGRPVSGSMTEMELGYCLRHLSTSVCSSMGVESRRRDARSGGSATSKMIR